MYKYAFSFTVSLLEKQKKQQEKKPAHEQFSPNVNTQ